MTTLLLVIIYIAFISLGLPDSMLGAAWPVMQAELGLPLAGAGLVSMIVSGCTIISSMFSGFLIRRLGTGNYVISVLTPPHCWDIVHQIASACLIVCLWAWRRDAAPTILWRVTLLRGI